MSRIKKVMLIAFIVICIITLGIVSYILINDNLENNSNKQDIEELIDDVFIQDIDTTEEPIIDWNYLKSINKDIICWIEIEGTEINYPILKDSVNLYYLKHNYLKNYNSNGSIFTLNNKPFEDEETLIYGHNMKNGTMFSLLGNYLNEDYLYSHQNIKIYTSEKNYKGVIFSAYSIGIGTEKNNISNLNYEERISYYKKSSKVNVNNVDITNKIIKLSTCSYINSRTRPTNQRYYIVATLNEIN